MGVYLYRALLDNHATDHVNFVSQGILQHVRHSHQLLHRF